MPGIENREKEIDGFKFTVPQLPAMRSLRMLRRLSSAFGPAVAQAFGSATGEVDFKGLASALEMLFMKLTEDELEQITKELLAQALVDGRPLLREMDLTLAGKPGTLLKLLAFSVEVNYGSFFAGLRERLAPMLAAQAKKVSASISATTNPTGPAGG